MSAPTLSPASRPRRTDRTAWQRFDREPVALAVEPVNAAELER
jgi:hypothetical protein